MRGPGVLAVASTLASLAVPGCLLYTKPINSPPVVMEIRAPREIYRGEPALFTAQVSDPDADPLVLEWSHTKDACPAPAAPALRPATDFIGELYTVSAAASGRLCVWLAARDPHGAVTVLAREAAVINHAPIARIEVQQPARNARGAYDLFSDFRLSAAGSRDDDRDMLRLTWSLAAPPASTARLEACPPELPKGVVQCLTADVPGRYAVELRVDDGFADPGVPASISLDVDEDASPCITDASPDPRTAVLVLDPARDLRFEVIRVHDDGDPFPAGSWGAASFAWSLRRGAGPREPIASYALAALTLPAGTFVAGETARLRVEGRDRHAGEPDRSLDRCGDADVCSPRPGCNAWVTWTVELR